MRRVQIYTDGACLGNPGPGGWAALLRYGHHERMLSGGEPCTTNNRMELKAALEGLKALKAPSEVDLYTDSQYLQKAFTEGWLESWQKRGWRTSEGQPVKNQDLWRELLKAMAPHRVRFHFVKGHAGHPENERVDREARRQAEAQRGVPCPQEGTLFPP
ncbi:ribonuclease H [Thermus composti]|uniref:Ribonuclease H n=1 Tax=Thermus composti TaxID=532059 RepID=A0ABV6Q3F0_9DEIN|nr:ribonuclease HI [Thermus composti]GGM96730.1 ribonuclease H [Thermus composti]